MTTGGNPHLERAAKGNERHGVVRRGNDPAPILDFGLEQGTGDDEDASRPGAQPQRAMIDVSLLVRDSV